MNLAEYLNSNAVRIATDISSKKRALEDISQLLTGHAEFVSEKDVLTSLINREKLGSTGLGKGIAIPHGRLKGLESPVAAFLKLSTPIDYDAADGDPVDLVFGLLVPQDASSKHLEILAGIAEMFHNSEYVDKLRACEDAQSIHQLLTHSAA